MKLPIYLDYSATTPVDPRVAQKMIPFLTEDFGNPASRSHPFGWTAEKAVEDARENVAKLVNCGAQLGMHLSRPDSFLPTTATCGSTWEKSTGLTRTGSMPSNRMNEHRRPELEQLAGATFIF